LGADGGHLGPAQDWQSQTEIPDLTPEELAALQPKKTKVVNPWIHEQTHQEYLENITVSNIQIAGENSSAFAAGFNSLFRLRGSPTSKNLHLEGSAATITHLLFLTNPTPKIAFSFSASFFLKIL
jgi:hypothetical protein